MRGLWICRVFAFEILLWKTPNFRTFSHIWNKICNVSHWKEIGRNTRTLKHPISGVQNMAWDVHAPITPTLIDRGSRRAGVRHVRIILSAIWAGLSSTSAVGQKPPTLAENPKRFPLCADFHRSQPPDFGSSAVTRTTSYCWESLVEVVKVCGCEYSVG